MKNSAPVPTAIAGSNYVSALQEHIMKEKSGTMPTYSFSRKGPDHMPIFTCTAELVTNGRKILGSGEGGSKSEAKQAAASDLWKKIQKVK